MNISPPNYSALAALAGTQHKSQLPEYIQLLLQDQQMKLADNQEKRRLWLEQQKIRSSDEQAIMQRGLLSQQMSQQADQSQQENAYKQALLQQQGLLGQGELDYRNATLQQQGQLGQGELDYKNAALQQTRQLELAKEMAKMLDNETKESLKEKGAYAMQLKLSLDAAKTPEEKQLIRNEGLNEALSKGIISKEEADMARKAPLSVFDNMLMGKMAMWGTISSYKIAHDVQNPKESSGMKVYDPQTGKLVYTSTASKENITKAQEEYLDATLSLKQLEPYINPPENFFGLAAAKHDVTYLRELGKSIGLGGDQKDVNEMALYNKFDANAKLNIMKTAKTMAGARFSDADLKMIEQIMPQVGKLQTRAEYMAKADLVKNFLMQSQITRKEILKTGQYKLGTEEYDREFSARLPSTIEKAEIMNDAIKFNMDKYGYSEEEARQLLMQRL